MAQIPNIADLTINPVEVQDISQVIAQRLWQNENFLKLFNVVAWVSQSKEDRDAKKSRFFVGNGRVIWGDGLIPKDDTSEQASSSTLIVGDDDDLPF